MPDALVPSSAHEHVRALARRLPPVHTCGFEARLGESQDEVDFQQGVSRAEGDPARLRAHLEGLAGDPRAVQALGEFVAEWEEPGSVLHDAVNHVWLEFDRPPSDALSLFARFDKPTDTAAAFEAVRATVDVLAAGPAADEWSPTVTRCAEALPEGSFVSHVGAMLGRPAPFLRINVARVPADAIEAYLHAVGWPGPVAEPARIMHRMRGLADFVTLCLDVGAAVGPRLGFECSLGRQPPEEPGWLGLLDELVDSGMCTREKRDALLAWPGLTTPATSSQGWPADLVRRSLRQPADRLTTLERQLSHVKLSYEPGRPLSAKGYFGYLHRWQRPGVDDDGRPGSEESDAHAAPGRNGRPASARSTAAGRAIAFLLAARTRAGLWRDFDGSHGATEDWAESMGPSDEWVSAFVGVALAHASDAEATSAARHAFGVLAERRLPLAGWGYHRWLPVDADSTAWVLRLAEAVGRADCAAARAGRAELDRYELADGGVAPYLAGACPRPRAERLVPPEGSYAGWSEIAHACVTAGACLGSERRRRFLRGAQRADGSWESYWWEDDEYATGLAAEALAAGGADDRRSVERAVGWAAGRLDADGSVAGSPFATAWALRVLRHGGQAERERRERATEWLRAQQQADGGWAASARLVAPRPDALSRADGPVAPMASLDEARTFTTATVLEALREVS